jgi:excisionase family DNA binding protein
MTKEEIENLPALLNPKQVAQMLGICQRQAQLLAERGKLPAVKVGGLWRFPKEAILKSVGLA